MPTMNISLPDPMKEFVEAEVSSGNYSSVSEYIRSLVRVAQETKAQHRLSQLLLDGLSSGDPIEATSEFWQDIRSDVKARIAEHKQKHGRS